MVTNIKTNMKKKLNKKDIDKLKKEKVNKSKELIKK
jgi:hypothetical protein